MTNPMLQMLNKSKPLNNNMLNPQAMVQNMLAQNPQVMNLINRYGGDPKAAFYGLAREKGINPDDFLRMLKK